MCRMLRFPPFNYVIGNPPYNSHLVTRKHIRHFKRIGQAKTGTEGFILASLDFLASGGRAYLICPLSFTSREGSKVFREELNKVGSITDFTYVPNPNRWVNNQTVSLSSSLAVVTIEKTVGLGYTIGGKYNMTLPVGSDLKYIVPKTRIEFEIYCKVWGKANHVFGDIAEYLPPVKLTPEPNKSIGLKCFEGEGNPRNYFYVKDDGTQNVSFERLGVAQFFESPMLRIRHIPKGEVRAKTIIFNNDIQTTAPYLKHKLFSMLYTIINPNKSVNTLILSTPIWPAGADPYKFFGLTDTEKKYVENLEFGIKF